MTGEQNLFLIREIEANRDFLLTVLSQNPVLLARAEPRIRQLMEPLSATGEASGGRCLLSPTGTSETSPPLPPRAKA
jgi:hypothetical protein